jgi:LysM repeat protein
MDERGAMVRRSRWRYLAPIALAAAITGTYLVVHNGLMHKSSTSQSHVSTHGHSTTTTTRRGKASKSKIYVVRPGDTLSGISQKTGVSIQTIQALNRNLNPNSLQTAQRLRLRR